MRKLSTIFVLVGLLGMAEQANGQASIQDSTISLFTITAVYSLEMPGGDMKERFGRSNFLGGGGSYKTANNWLYTAEFQFLFGREVKEDPLKEIKSDQGYLINGQGTLEPLPPRQRGYRALIKAGKVFPWVGPNPNSGIFGQIGAGFIQHKIDWQNQSQAVHQIKNEYIKGYDRLTNGIIFTETLGYMNFSDNKLFNFSASFQFGQAFTKNRRDWNYDQMQSPDEQRLDLFYGIRMAWSFPIYEQADDSYYIY